MYELVKKILDTAKKENVDVGVAYDMVATETGYTDELKKANEFIDKNYETITALRVKECEEDIKYLCKLAECDNNVAIDHHTENLKDKGVI